MRAKLAGAPVEVTAHGLLVAEQVVQILGGCEVLLFARGPLSTQRGSAIAGIACGLPVVVWEGAVTAGPVTEAGVVLVSEGTREGLGPALLRVLSDEPLRALLAERSRRAYEKYFSWGAIAARYVEALRKAETGEPQERPEKK